MTKKLYIGAIWVVLVYAAFHALISTWLISNFGHAMIFKSLKDIFVVALGLSGIYQAIKNRLLLSRFEKQLASATIIFVVVVLGYCFFGQPADVVYAGLIITLRFYILFGAYFVAARLGWLEFNSSFLKKLAKLTFWPVVVFGVLQVWLLPKDFLRHFGYGFSTIPAYQTVDNNQNYVRIISTLRGPNPLGAYLALWIVLLVGFLAWRKSKKQSVYILAGLCLALMTLYFSYSRSALLATLIGIMVIVLMHYKKSFNKLKAGLLLIFGGLLLISFLGLRHNETFSRVVLHNDPTESSRVNSDDQHAQSLKQGITELRSRPLGHGTGMAGLASTYGDKPNIIENYFLEIGYQYGWIGLGLIIIIQAMLLWRLLNLALQQPELSGVFGALVGLGFISLLLPVWTDETVAYTFWGLAGLAIGQQVYTSNRHGKRNATAKN